MKRCPYCAEEIQDEAIKCRYCFSDLTVPPPTSPIVAAGPGSPGSVVGTQAPSASDPAAGAPGAAGTSGTWSASAGNQVAPAGAPEPGPVSYTHSGYRYVLGFGPDFFGIWDRQAPSTPAERFARDDEGWKRAWTRFSSLEPSHVAVPQSGTGGPEASGGSRAAFDPQDTDVLQYTHSGQRYLLGYGRTFFGIWDRQSPATPVERFTRDDAGWQQAWRRFTSLETHFTEVGLAGGGQPSGTAPS